MAGCPPRAQGVFEQKLYHVVLSKKLGNRSQIFCTNLSPAIVHFLFLLRLPKLVDPAKSIVSDKEYRGQLGNDALEFMPPLRRELHSWIISSKNTGKHGTGITRG